MSQRPERPLPPKVKINEAEDCEHRSVRTFRTSSREPKRQRPRASTAARICVSPVVSICLRRLVDPRWPLRAIGSQRTIEPIEFATGAHRIPHAGTYVKANTADGGDGDPSRGFSVTWAP